MKFAIGYQAPSAGFSTAELALSYKEHISEVYFSWPGMSSGRPPVFGGEDISPEEGEQILLQELKVIKEAGIGPDLLLNANCYGKDSISAEFEHEICSVLSALEAADVLPSVVTTTSPFAAEVVKKHYPSMEIRASVNMRIGTVQAMKYASSLFDSFYIQRDFQRDIEYVKKVSAWCKDNGKKLCMLANSGCLRFCPGQSFHDNLIAHASEVRETKNLPGFDPHTCWRLYKDETNRPEILKSTFIRPEDLYRYEGLVDVVKLATRQHSHPAGVVGAYTAGTWNGDLLELFEPGFSPVFYPFYLDNSLVPEDFFEKTSHCTFGCTDCGYCEEVYRKILKNYETDLGPILTCGF